ncbi:MAG: PsbP-related protein [Olleya sp.]
MKHKLTALVIFFALISSSIFSQEDWHTFEEENFSISYPKNWSSSDKKPNPLVKAIFFSPEFSQEKDQFRENVNVTVENLQGKDLSIEDYTKIALDQVKKQIPTAKIID